jgi:hypothetical protein
VRGNTAPCAAASAGHPGARPTLGRSCSRPAATRSSCDSAPGFYLQIDDGYQRGTGLPKLWLRPNERFPEGLEATARDITGKGLTPGIWTDATFSQTDVVWRNDPDHIELSEKEARRSTSRGTTAYCRAAVAWSAGKPTEST